MPKYDIITIGDSGIDTLVSIHDANVHCFLNKDDCQLCIRYADKIIADDMQTKTAYNAMNNAVGSARLGLRTAFYTVLGDGASGRRILDTLVQEKVDTRYVKIDRQRKSNASVVINFKGERTILVYHENFHYQLPRLATTKWFYLTTMGQRFLPVYSSLVKRLRRTKEKLGFNPGSFQLKAGAAKLKPVFKTTNALFLNKEEARLMTHIPEERNIKDLLQAMLKLGPEIAVITDGVKGSFAAAGVKFYHLPIIHVPTIERTGAGDSYGTAFVAALYYGHDVKEAMRWGTVNSASVVQKIGPQDGLLKLSFLKLELKKHSRLQPRVI